MSKRINKAPVVLWISMAAALCLITATAEAQQIGSARQGHRLARTVCAQCHAVDEQPRPWTNPNAPSFEAIANIPGMTSAALSVALQTSHRSMPNFVIKGQEAQNIIAYILSLKRRD
jgi:mono/diheme cytochrome c family protein